MKVSEERRRQALAMHKEGKSAHIICRTLKMHNESLHKILGMAGLRTVTKPSAKAERNAAIIEMFDGGVRPQKIIDQTGLSRGTVLGVLHRAGRKLGGQELRRAQSAGGKKGGGVRWGEPRKQPPRTKLAIPAPIREAQPIKPGVSLLERTGCCWPIGDVKSNPPVTYCNAPKIRVRRAIGWPSEPVAYCAEHWEMRRSGVRTIIVEVMANERAQTHHA